MDLSLYACVCTFSIFAWTSLCAYLAWVQDNLLFQFSTCEMKWNQIQLAAIITLRQMSTNFIKIHEPSPNSRCWKDDIKQVPYSVLVVTSEPHVLEWAVKLTVTVNWYTFLYVMGKTSIMCWKYQVRSHQF